MRRSIACLDVSLPRLLVAAETDAVILRGGCLGLAWHSSNIVCLCGNLQVTKGIVPSIAVDVVDNLVSGNYLIFQVLEDEPMKRFVAAFPIIVFEADINVSIRCPIQIIFRNEDNMLLADKSITMAGARIIYTAFDGNFKVLGGRHA
jgi:hypothetical protein